MIWNTQWTMISLYIVKFFLLCYFQINIPYNPSYLNKYIITECVKREAISLIYVFQFMKQNIMYLQFDDFHKIISEI